MQTATLQSGNLATAVSAGANDGVTIAGTSLGTHDFISLKHGIDPLYRPNTSCMAHDSVWKQVRKTKDKYGRPMWQPSLTAGQADTINGYRMLTNNFMTPLQVSSETSCDMSEKR